MYRSLPIKRNTIRASKSTALALLVAIYTMALGWPRSIAPLWAQTAGNPRLPRSRHRPRHRNYPRRSPPRSRRFSRRCRLWRSPLPRLRCESSIAVARDAASAPTGWEPLRRRVTSPPGSPRSALVSPIIAIVNRRPRHKLRAARLPPRCRPCPVPMSPARRPN